MAVCQILEERRHVTLGREVAGAATGESCYQPSASEDVAHRHVVQEIAGTSIGRSHGALNVCSVYMAPFGDPMLPEV